MEYSGFFNAMYVDNEYDRKYNANDYSDNLAVVISNGVLRSGVNDLKVTANNMVCSVNAGRAWIDGHYYYNDSFYSFNQTVPPVGANRYDRIMLRLDNTIIGRNISLVYVQGNENEYPAKPAPVRDGDYYDLVLADVLVSRNSGTLVITDTRDDENLCGWVYSTIGNGEFFTALDSQFEDWFNETKDNLASVTLFKKYTWETTLAQSASQVAFSIPQYDAETCFIEVYVNGLYNTDYTVSNNVVTFGSQLATGTKIVVNAYKSIDGTGIMTVADEITALQEQMEHIIADNKYTYVCKGVDDNIIISEIVDALQSDAYIASNYREETQAFISALGGTSYISALDEKAKIEIDIVGKLGVGNPLARMGSDTNVYFYLVSNAVGNGRHITLDFSRCERIEISTNANVTRTIIFAGSNIDIIGANVYADATETNSSLYGAVYAKGGGSFTKKPVTFRDCTLDIHGKYQIVGFECGDLYNCNVRTVANAFSLSSAGTAMCINAPSSTLIRVYGGTYYAYAKSSTNPAVLNVEASSDGVILGYGLNCPSETISGVTQKYYAKKGTNSTGTIRIDGIITQLEKSGDVTEDGVVSGSFVYDF